MGILRKKIGNFYLVQRLGSPGRPAVFLAINPRTREKRAFKIFGKPAAPNFSEYTLFLREVDVLRRLSHPGIIRILDSGIFEDGCYYAMEFIPKGNLNRILTRGKMMVDGATGLFIRICEAMEYAHAKGIIHRNLKPSNILFNSAGDPVVSDFGFMQVLDFDRTMPKQSGEILGAIAYQAPEQRFAAKKHSQRADVYALGAMFYEMLMGFPPLGKFPWPMDVQSNFPEPLQSILEKCLAIEQANRFQHAGALHRALEKCRELTSGEKALISTSTPGNRSPVADERISPRTDTDRIETWFRALRTGTAQERLATVRDMIDKIDPAEAKAILKLYSEEGDRVRWGLIRVLGELKIQSATPLILNDLKSSFHTEYALEALGKIGSDEAYNAIREYVMERPEYAIDALLPLARTGKERGIRYLRRYLNNEISALRQAAVQALATIASEESLHALKEHLCIEKDERVRSSLFQAVHSLQSILLPDIEMPLQSPGAVLKSRSQ